METVSILFSPWYEPLAQMEATGDFFRWWYEAGGIGGWVIFFLLDMAAIAWLIYDSQTRRIQAVGWLLGAILPMLLLLPSAIFGFSSATRNDMQDLQEVFFYLGLIGGIVPIVVTIGYIVTYQGMRGCEKGHIYQTSQGECPTCALEPVTPGPGPVIINPPPPSDSERDPGPSGSWTPPPPSKPKTNAWLVDEGSNRNYQLFQGDTRAGRGKENDVVFTDKAVSREHMLIREERGHFTIYDRGAKMGIYINDRRMERPILLAHDDVIEIGDTRLRFMTSQG